MEGAGRGRKRKGWTEDVNRWTGQILLTGVGYRRRWSRLAVFNSLPHVPPSSPPHPNNLDMADLLTVVEGAGRGRKGWTEDVNRWSRLDGSDTADGGGGQAEVEQPVFNSLPHAPPLPHTHTTLLDLTWRIC